MNDETNEANGVYWYFAEDRAFGFSRVPEVHLGSADVLGSGYGRRPRDEDGKYRLSWHVTGEDGGWRAGQHTDVDEEARVITPPTPPLPPRRVCDMCVLHAGDEPRRLP